MIPYLIAGAIGYAVAKIFEEDEAPKYADGGSVLLAPNGKPSNLTPEQYKLVRTPAFKEWFGDWENDPTNASKVVDSNGEPLVVYHGTTESFSVFDTKKIDIGTNTTSDGFFFSTNKEYIKKFGNKYLECFLKIKTPIIIDEKGKSKKLNKNEIDKVISNRIKDKNVDDDFLFDSKGFLDIIYGKTKKVQTSYGQLNYVLKYIFKNDYEDYSNRLFTETKIDGFFRQDTFICLFSNQIKLADGTNTTFDGNNPDIRYADGGSVSLKKLLDFKLDEVQIDNEYAHANLGIEQLSDGEVSIYISEIWSDIKGEGYATKLLNKLKKFSNKRGVPLSLRASVSNNIQISGGLNQQELVDWYIKNGFKISEKDNNFETDSTAPFMVYNR